MASIGICEEWEIVTRDDEGEIKNDDDERDFNFELGNA